jgi:hypothetical protein
MESTGVYWKPGTKTYVCEGRGKRDAINLDDPEAI